MTDLGGSTIRSPRGHSPTARMLMSLTEAALPWSRPPVPFRPTDREEGIGLWPSLGLSGREPPRDADERSNAMSDRPPAVQQLPAPHTEHHAPPATVAPATVPRGYAERVIRAPQ